MQHTMDMTIPIPIKLDELATTIWRLPKRDREALEDVLEEQFVHTMLDRAKEIPRLRRQKKLFSLEQMQRALD